MVSVVMGFFFVKKKYTPFIIIYEVHKVACRIFPGQSDQHDFTPKTQYKIIV